MRINCRPETSWLCLIFLSKLLKFKSFIPLISYLFLCLLIIFCVFTIFFSGFCKLFRKEGIIGFQLWDFTLKFSNLTLMFCLIFDIFIIFLAKLLLQFIDSCLQFFSYSFLLSMQLAHSLQLMLLRLIFGVCHCQFVSSFSQLLAFLLFISQLFFFKFVYFLISDFYFIE